MVTQPVNGWLLKAVDADVNGTGITTDGGSKTVQIWATNFGGGTVTLQSSADGGVTWVTLTIAGLPATFTSNAVRKIDRLGQGMLIRATLAGSTGASNVNVKLFQ